MDLYETGLAMTASESSMSGIEDAKTIDLVTINGQVGEVYLVMIATRPWGTNGDFVLQLQDKFRTYLNFVESGDLVRRFPESRGKRVVIRIDCASPPGFLENRLLRLVQSEWLDPLGIRVEVQVVK